MKKADMKINSGTPYVKKYYIVLLICESTIKEFGSTIFSLLILSSLL